MKGHWIPPAPRGFIDRIAAKLGYSKTIPSGLGTDLVDAVSTLNDQIGDLTPQSTYGAFTIVSTAIVDINTQKTIRIGNILIIELLFRINNNITDGDILFTLNDTSILFDATQVTVADVRSVTAVPFMARTNYNTRNITAWSNFTPDSGINTWCSLEFIVEIKEA